MKQSKKTAFQIMYETVIKNGGPTGPISQAIVDTYEGRTTKTFENKRIVQFKRRRSWPNTN